MGSFDFKFVGENKSDLFLKLSCYYTVCAEWENYLSLIVDNSETWLFYYIRAM
jgi:hypothetical protein